MKTNIIDKDLMGEGYEFMAHINLEICQENFHLETEGESMYEMGKKEAEDKAV